MNNQKQESYNHMSHWYKKQVENCLLKASQHLEKGDVTGCNYYEQEASNYQLMNAKLEKQLEEK